jgi:hypothetical protein
MHTETFLMPAGKRMVVLPSKDAQEDVSSMPFVCCGTKKEGKSYPKGRYERCGLDVLARRLRPR